MRPAPFPVPLLAALFALPVLAGCAGPPTPSIPGPADAALACVPDADAIPFGAGHSHRDPATHRLACNAALLAWDDLRRFGWSPETVVGAHAVDIHGGLLAVAVNAGESDEGQQGFHLFDVSDPQRLRHVSHYRSEQPVGGDRTIAFSGDGRTIYLGYEGEDVRPGVAAVDVSDPANPVERAFWDDPQNYGSHTIAAGTIAGTPYVFALAMGVNVLRDDGDRLTLVGKYLTADQLSALGAPGSSTGASTYAVRSLYGHDMTFFADPGEGGRALLFVAYAYDGLKVVDVTVPSAPVLAGRWLPPADTAHRPYTHSVAAERAADGRLLLVVGSETFEAENQAIASPVWVLDATETVGGAAGTGLGVGPDPTHLGTWRNPAKAPAGNLGLSVHFFRIEAGILYLSHYHGGIWQVPLRSAAERADPQATGYAMPVPPGAVEPPEGCCIGFDLSGAPMVFDVVVQGGVAYGADLVQGVTATRFAEPPA